MTVTRKKRPSVFSADRKPYLSAAVLTVIILACLMADFIMPYDPTYMNLG